MIIPIGGTCSVAFQAKSLKVRSDAYPFDKIKSTLDDICNWIESEFYGWLDKDNYEIVGEKDNFKYINSEFKVQENNSLIIRNKKLNIVFPHDVTNEDKFEDQIDNFIKIYDRRISRFYQHIKKSRSVLFVRDELKPKKLKMNNIKRFCCLIRKINPIIGIHIKIILANPQKKKLQLLTEDKPDYVTFINDQSEWKTWRRELVNWNEIFIEDIIVISKQYHFRSKVDINLPYVYNKEFMKTLDERLYEPIKFMLNWIEENDVNFRYFTIQVTTKGELALMIHSKETFNDEWMSDFDMFKVIGVNEKVISKKTKLIESYHDIIWKRSFGAFFQINHSIGYHIHNYVLKQLKKCKGWSYYGIGGEGGFYGYYLYDQFSSFTFISNYQSIINDATDACGKLSESNDIIKLVDYSNVKLNDYYSESKEGNLLLLNVSRRGIKDMSKQITKMDFDKIILIGCCEKYVRNDITNLSERYLIEDVKIYQAYPGTENFIYVTILS